MGGMLCGRWLLPDSGSRQRATGCQQRGIGGVQRAAGVRQRITHRLQRVAGSVPRVIGGVTRVTADLHAGHRRPAALKAGQQVILPSGYPIEIQICPPPFRRRLQRLRLPGYWSQGSTEEG